MKVRGGGGGDDDDDDEHVNFEKKNAKNEKKKQKEKTPRKKDKRTSDSSEGKKRKKDDKEEEEEEEERHQGGEKGKEKKRKIRQTRTEAANAKVEELNMLNSEKTCRICEKTLAAKKFAAKQLLKAKPACMACSKKRAEMAATNDNGAENKKPERLKKMTKREKLDAAIQRRKQQREEKKKQKKESAAPDDNDGGEKKDEREENPASAGEEAQKEFVPAKMVPSKTERDVDESDEVAQRSMYCGGIPFHKTEDDIRAAFDEEGLEVDSVDCMVFADSGRFRGIAIITFHNVADRDEALKFDGEDWEGFAMVCKPYKVKKAAASTKEPPKKIDGQRVVFVANLDYSVTEDLLRETFAQGSEIKEIRMGLDKDTQDFKGFAHIEFVSDGDLARALKKNGRELLGREMKVVYATERRKNSANSSAAKGGESKKRSKKSKSTNK